jgi:hypothetical protein
LLLPRAETAGDPRSKLFALRCIEDTVGGGKKIEARLLPVINDGVDAGQQFTCCDLIKGLVSKQRRKIVSRLPRLVAGTFACSFHLFHGSQEFLLLGNRGAEFREGRAEHHSTKVTATTEAAHAEAATAQVATPSMMASKFTGATASTEGAWSASTAEASRGAGAAVAPAANGFDEACETQRTENKTDHEDSPSAPSARE